MEAMGLLCVILLLRYVSGDATLTTAKIRDYTSAKPTTLYRRINVERNFEKQNTPLDLFKLRDPELRRSHSEIWNWDYWCQQQPKMGNCTRNLLRFYYDAQLDQCLTFSFTGCNANKNNFVTLIDCERYCKGAAYMPAEDTRQPKFCTLQPDAGLCLAFYTRYYYDINEAKCRSFVYGGCGGNQNNFDTKDTCRESCQGEDNER